MLVLDANTGILPENELQPAAPQRAARSVDRLVKSHHALVRKIAWHVSSRMSNAIEYDDLMQIGLIALVEAAQNFEDRGIAFASYASTRVRGAMIDALRRDAWICRSGMRGMRDLDKARRVVEQRLMRPASDRELAAEMGLTMARYRDLQANARAVTRESIDEAYTDQDMCFADMSEAADTTLEKQQLRETLVGNLDRLPEREKQVLQLYFVEEMSLEEVGLTLGLGAARICQIKKAAIEKLRLAMIH